jgi:hypothetical protein
MNAPSPVDKRQLRKLQLALLPEVLECPANNG